MNIIITGASSGIGYQAVVHLLQSPHHDVVAIARDVVKLKSLEKLTNTSRLHTISFDLIHGNYNAILKPFIANCFPEVDILINNAGTLINRPFQDLTTLDVNEMIQSNFIVHFNMIQAVLPQINNGGHILNIGSMGGFQGSTKFPGLSAYSASKAALHTLTECLALELVPQNIKVNCLALGSAQTEMLEQAFSGYKAPVTANEMGKYVAEFAIHGHKFHNGKVLPVSTSTP